MKNEEGRIKLLRVGLAGGGGKKGLKKSVIEENDRPAPEWGNPRAQKNHSYSRETEI